MCAPGSFPPVLRIIGHPVLLIKFTRNSLEINNIIIIILIFPNKSRLTLTAHLHLRVQ